MTVRIRQRLLPFSLDDAEVTSDPVYFRNLETMCLEWLEEIVTMMP